MFQNLRQVRPFVEGRGKPKSLIQAIRGFGVAAVPAEVAALKGEKFPLALPKARRPSQSPRQPIQKLFRLRDSDGQVLVVFAGGFLEFGVAEHRKQLVTKLEMTLQSLYADVEFRFGIPGTASQIR